MDTFEVFYVGIGREINYKRAYNKYSRNNWWKRVVNKTEYQVEILASNLIKEEACELEMLLIQEYGRKDLGKGNLVNMTDGGESNSGFVTPEHVKKKQSEARKGKPTVKGEAHPMFGKFGELHHNFNKVLSQETKDKIKKSLLGTKASIETKQKISKALLGKTRSEKTKALMRESFKGGNSSRARLVLCTETGIFYDCIKYASLAYNIKYGTLKDYLRGKHPNKTTLILC